MAEIKRARQGNLPAPSYIHHTGHGIHAVWATNQIMPPNEWLPTARVLRGLAEDFGLDVDGEVTTDAARVLRVPNTINFRDRAAPGQGHRGSRESLHAEISSILEKLTNSKLRPVSICSTY